MSSLKDITTGISDREIKMFEDCFCSECDKLAQYKLDERTNCFEQSPINKKHCANFVPNKDKI